MISRDSISKMINNKHGGASMKKFEKKNTKKNTKQMAKASAWAMGKYDMQYLDFLGETTLEDLNLDTSQVDDELRLTSYANPYEKLFNKVA